MRKLVWIAASVIAAVLLVVGGITVGRATTATTVVCAANLHPVFGHCVTDTTGGVRFLNTNGTLKTKTYMDGGLFTNYKILYCTFDGKPWNIPRYVCSTK